MRPRINVGVPRRVVVASTNEETNKLLSDLSDRRSVLSKTVIISEKKGIGRDKIIEISETLPGKSDPIVIQTMPTTKRLLKLARKFESKY